MISEFSSQKLAFVGDAVFDLMVRRIVSTKFNKPIGVLHDLKVSHVCCTAQASLADKITPLLTDKELVVYKRGRNAHVGKAPKKISVGLYYKATGLEALIGFWYLSKNTARLKELENLVNININKQKYPKNSIS